MTKEERRLWYDFLRQYPVRFLRQKILGTYIADFYCARVKLVIELDGAQHTAPDAVRYDAARSEFLSKFGIRVIRIPNKMVRDDFSRACACIDEIVKQSLSQLR